MGNTWNIMIMTEDAEVLWFTNEKQFVEDRLKSKALDNYDSKEILNNSYICKIKKRNDNQEARRNKDYPSYHRSKWFDPTQERKTNL